MIRSSFRAAFASAAVSGLLLGALVASPVAAANSVTVHIGCASGKAPRLAQAIRDANQRAPKTTVIYLATGCDYSYSHAHNFPGAFSANALPPVKSHIVIHGQGGATISRKTGAPRFRLVAVAANGNLSVDHVTFLNGAARNGKPGSSFFGADGTDGTDGHDGGAIYNLGTLTLDNVTLNNNEAGNGGGGGSSIGEDALDGAVGVSGSNALLARGGNAGAGGRGGAIYSTGSLTITNSTLTDNRAGNGGTGGAASGGRGGNGGSGNPGGNGGNGGAAAGGNGGPGGYGGAIWSSGALSISTSDISANATGNGGGGGTATGGNGGNGANTDGEGGAGGSVNSLSASGGTGTAIYLWAGHADVLNDTINTNTGGDGGSVSVFEGNGGNGGCDGPGGIKGSGGAGGGNAGTYPIVVGLGATATTTGTSFAGNADGSQGLGVVVTGTVGANGPACP